MRSDGSEPPHGRSRFHSIGAGHGRQPTESRLYSRVELRPSGRRRPGANGGAASFARIDATGVDGTRQVMAPLTPGSSRPGPEAFPSGPLTPGGTGGRSCTAYHDPGSVTASRVALAQKLMGSARHGFLVGAAMDGATPSLAVSFDVVTTAPETAAVPP
jgi:hypothetical protein